MLNSLLMTVHGKSQKTASSLDAGNMGVTVDKSVEFSYEELAQATDNFNMANMIGSGGFGHVYYAELRGEVCMALLLTLDSGFKLLILDMHCPG